jgi:hypothetical protein
MRLLYSIIAITSMLALLSLRVERTKLDAPETNGLIADSNVAFGKEIVNIAVAEVESREDILYADLKMPE